MTFSLLWSNTPGEMVGKDELIARVWPNTHVDEGNLKFQISALRRTLGGGNRHWVNVPGRGYSFVAPESRYPLGFRIPQLLELAGSATCRCAGRAAPAFAITARPG